LPLSPQFRILIDATAIPRSRGGVGRYLQFLIPALDAAGASLTVIAQAHDAEWMRAAAPEASIVAAPGWLRSRPMRLVWEQLVLPVLAARHSASVVFSPHYTMPVLSRIPVVVTLHDATFFSHPELHSKTKARFFRFWIRYSLRRAAACIVPSEATRGEVLRHARGDAARVHVVSHGVDGEHFRPPSAAEVGAAGRLLGAEEWIAFLGTLEPRKNVANLVRAFGAVSAGRSADQPELVLALMGGRGWDEALETVIAESPVTARIRRLGFVDDDALAGLLGGAAIVAYPSLGEGFGLPVLEAMACGAPVVTTRLLALPEVGGDVAVYTEPDADAIARTLTALLANPAERAERAERGLARAAEFSWGASARTHLAVFAGAASASGAAGKAV
jgi:glycosyltransferase involved in cell wall biosynthesis